MDKRVIFAVAGSGKTTYIINQLNLDKKALIVTYTVSNTKNLYDGIVNKFGYFPDNIYLYTYFTFLYTFCYRPFLLLKLPSKGINYEANPSKFIKQSNIQGYYFDKYDRLYSNRIAKLLEVRQVLPEVNTRLAKYFDDLYIDEVQDFAGHDFDLLLSLFKANITVVAVGDFFQHTFDTSRDGNTNKNLHSDYQKYKKVFTKAGICVDVDSLKFSHRCSPSVCDFVTKNVGIEIYSSRCDATNVCLIENQEEVDLIFNNSEIVKLFLREHYKYGCYSKNWGECKGENKYFDVAVVLNSETVKEFRNNSLRDLQPITKNKLYVACTRAKNNLYLIPDAYYKKYKRSK